MKIEKYKKINGGKYQIFLDNGTVINIYEDVIVKYNLLYKGEVDTKLLSVIEKENEYQEAYNLSLKYLAIRLRSSYEVRAYLGKKNYNEEVIMYVIERLERNNFLNDEVFARSFIKDKLNFTTMGKYKIISLLKKHRVDDDIINNAIMDINEEIWSERIKNLGSKYLKSKNKYSGNVLKNKLYLYLVNLGYDKNLVISYLSNTYF